jgi:hypothetical protein
MAQRNTGHIIRAHQCAQSCLTQGNKGQIIAFSPGGPNKQGPHHQGTLLRSLSTQRQCSQCTEREIEMFIYCTQDTAINEDVLIFSYLADRQQHKIQHFLLLHHL